MYVEHNQERKYTFTLMILGAVFLSILVHFDLKALNIINELIQKLVATDFSSVIAIDHLLLFFCHPIMCWLYALILWFFLWGFKHKISAIWTLTTFVSGEVGLMLLHFFDDKVYISGSFFSLIIIIHSASITLFPLVKDEKISRIIKIGLRVFVIMVAIALIRLDNISLWEIIISWLISNVWIWMCQGQYGHLAGRLQRATFLGHSKFN